MLLTSVRFTSFRVLFYLLTKIAQEVNVLNELVDRGLEGRHLRREEALVLVPARDQQPGLAAHVDLKCQSVEVKTFLSISEL